MNCRPVYIYHACQRARIRRIGSIFQFLVCFIDWTAEDVKRWLCLKGFQEEAPLFLGKLIKLIYLLRHAFWNNWVYRVQKLARRLHVARRSSLKKHVLILDTLFNYLVTVEDINGKVLGELNRETVKELGVKQIGRQLALLKMIKSLFGKGFINERQLIFN